MLLDLILAWLNQAVESLEYVLNWKSIYAKWYAERVARGEYADYERRHFWVVRSKLPIGQYPDDEIRDRIREWAFDAALRFDIERGTEFVAFLNKHLQMCGLRLYEHAWREKNYPKDKKWVKTESDWWGEGELGLAGFCSEGTDQPKPPIEVEEVVSDLSPMSRAVFNTLSSDHDLIKMVNSRNQRNRLAETCGIPREILEEVFAEVAVKGRAFS